MTNFTFTTQSYSDVMSEFQFEYASMVNMYREFPTLSPASQTVVTEFMERVQVVNNYIRKFTAILQPRVHLNFWYDTLNPTLWGVESSSSLRSPKRGRGKRF